MWLLLLTASPLHGKHWCNGLGSNLTAGNSYEPHILGFTILNGILKRGRQIVAAKKQTFCALTFVCITGVLVYTHANALKFSQIQAAATHPLLLAFAPTMEEKLSVIIPSEHSVFECLSV